MHFEHFPEVLLQAIRQQAMSPEEFARETGLPILELAHLLAGEPLPRQNYQAIFSGFHKNRARALMTRSLARAFLLDCLVDSEVELETAEALILDLMHDSAIAHLFQDLPTKQLLALSTVGVAARRSPGVEKALFELAEASRAMIQDKSIPAGFFSTATPGAGLVRLPVGSLGDLVALIEESGQREGAGG